MTQAVPEQGTTRKGAPMIKTQEIPRETLLRPIFKAASNKSAIILPLDRSSSAGETDGIFRPTKEAI